MMDDVTGWVGDRVGEEMVGGYGVPGVDDSGKRIRGVYLSITISYEYIFQTKRCS